MRRRAALVLVVLAALAGCSLLPGGGSGPPSAETASEGYADLESVEGVLVYEHRSADGASNTTVRTVRRPGERMTRQRFHSPSQLAGDVTVTNGSVHWQYDASENTVTRRSVEGLNFSTTSNSELLERVFGNITGSGDSSPVTSPSLPVGPLNVGGGDAGLTRADLAGPTRFEVSYLGTDTVAGRPAHGVELGPVTDPESDGLSRFIENATYWYDAEYFYPLETRTVISIDEQLTRSVQRFRNVTFNPDAPASRFRFEPPANATVRTPPETQYTDYDTVAGAEADVAFDLPDPDVPSDFGLESVTVSRVDGATTARLDYANATRELTVSVRGQPFESLSDGESVSLGPVNATAASPLDSTVFRWSCGGLGYSVRGETSRAELRDVARSVASAC